MPSHPAVDLLAQRVNADIMQLDAQALHALVPAMAQAQRELTHQLHTWLTKLGPNAAELKFTAAQLRQAQILLGIAQATAAGKMLSFPTIVQRAVQQVMGQAHAPAKAIETMNAALQNLRAHFDAMPPQQLLHAGYIAKGDKLAINRYKTSAARYAGQVRDDLRFQLAVGLSKGETLQELVQRVANLGTFRQAVDASSPMAAGQMGAALTQRYHNWGRRLVVTELNNTYNYESRQSIIRAHQIDKSVMMQWDATNDLRVCPTCRGLHGKKVNPRTGIFTKSKARGNVDQPPAHPYCRCTLVPWWPAMEEEPPSMEDILADVPSVHEVDAEELDRQMTRRRRR